MRIIDADALMIEFAGCGFLHESVICHTVGNAPTIDVVGVIHCKDCEHYRSSPFGHPSIGWCKLDGKHRGQNFYCAYGDKKNG